MRALLLYILFGIVSIPSYSQLVLDGSATGACDCYTVTDFTNQAGSVWSPTTIDLSNSFDFTFDINLGVDDVWGADGMVFALRQSGTASGSLGNGMGYSGITTSVGVEVDTWNSSPTVATDIVSDHVGMNSMGGVEHDLEGPFAIANIEDGAAHTFQVTWDPGTFDLEVILDGVSIFTHTEDLVTTYFGGVPDVYFGWTGGTGGVDNIQTVCMYRDAEITADLFTACVGQTVTFTDASTSDLIYNTDEAITWDWDFGDGATSALENPTHSYATAGTYTVTLTITDISGCSDMETLYITITDDLTIDMTQTDITCFGLDDGTGTATPVTGTGPYSYLWDDPATQITGTATVLGPTTYNVVVTDATGCTGTGTVTIVEPAELIIDNVTTTDVVCASDGTITITASGGTPALEYSIDGGAVFSPSGAFTGLTAETYDIVVRDANGCEVITTATIGTGATIVIDDVTVTDVSCDDTDDGTITITASGGGAPYEYSIDGGGVFDPSNFFGALFPGTYDIVVRDAFGCEATTTVTVGAISGVVIDGVVSTDVTCNGGTDGELTITASGGTPPYEYSSDGGAIFGPGATITGLAAGTYDIVVRDATGCLQTTTADVNEPSLITIDAAVVTDASCFGDADGEFVLTVSGGTPGYNYSNNAGVSFQVSPTFTGLTAGTYDLVIEDASGCTVTGTATVGEPLPMAIDDVIITDVTCDGAMDGGISVVASGGTLPYQYSVDGGPFQPSADFTGIDGGTVTITVEDANGCSIVGDAFITEADPLIMTLGPDTTICLGGMATLCPTVSGGTAPYNYIWDGAPDVECLVTAVIGDHDLIVTDINGCSSELEVQNLAQYVPLTAFASDDVTICPGDNVILAGEADGEGPSGYVFEWTNDVDGTILTGPVHTVNPTVNTTYILTVSAGCENTATTTVTVDMFPILNIDIDADRREGCADLDVQFTSMMDATLIELIQWDFGDGAIATGEAPAHVYKDPGCFDVEVRITTVDGCRNNAILDDYICVWQMPEAAFMYNPAEPDIFSPTVEYTNLSEDGSAYEWYFGDGGFSTNINPDHTYPDVGNQRYLVELVAESVDGCRDTTYQYLTIDEVVLYYVPNAFTPNEDPFNQTFGPVFVPGFVPRDFHFVIYNRWGEMVWESYDPSARWDGTYGDVFVEDGVYVWQVIYRENKSDKKHEDFGHITVIK